MRKLRNLLLLLVLLGAAMYFTNPSSEQFDVWMKARAKEQLDENQDGLFAGAFNDFFADLLGTAGTAIAKREEYHIASLYTVDLGEREYRYIGAFTTFIPLQSTDPISDLFGKGGDDE